MDTTFSICEYAYNMPTALRSERWRKESRSKVSFVLSFCGAERRGEGVRGTRRTKLERSRPKEEVPETNLKDEDS